MCGYTTSVNIAYILINIVNNSQCWPSLANSLIWNPLIWGFQEIMNGGRPKNSTLWTDDGHKETPENGIIIGLSHTKSF